jgi:hypothetical protein
MKFIRYGKYVGEPADAIDLEELVKRMGDFFLQSGFESQFYGVSQMDPDRSMEALREAFPKTLGAKSCAKCCKIPTCKTAKPSKI